MKKLRLPIDLRRLRKITAGYRLPKKESDFVLIIAGYLEGAYPRERIRKIIQALQDYFETIQ